MQELAEFKNVNCFFIVKNEKNEIYHVCMNNEEAKEMTDLYNATIHDEGKFTFQEIDLRQRILIEGVNS